MRILLDECCPRALKAALPEFTISTIEAAGFKGLSNGELQQNLKARRISILELPCNSFPQLKKRLPEIRSAIATIEPAEYKRIV